MAVYNEQLIDALVGAKERSGVSFATVGMLIGCKRNITHKYLTKQRQMKRSDTERKAVVAVRILNHLVDAGKLPAKNFDETVEVINDYLNSL